MKTAIVGGGAAGFFLGINLKEMRPDMEVSILESGSRVLRKVLASGGGRCNCTNTFRDVKDLRNVYPRGHQLMKRLMRTFGPHEAYEWFELHGIPLRLQQDGRVFPASNDAATIVSRFLKLARELGIQVVNGSPVSSLSQLSSYDFVAVTTGGSPRAEGLRWLQEVGHEVVAPVPSLFTLSIDDEALCALTGTAVEQVSVLIPGTKFHAEGALLITHWGLSGPVILRLSSYAARHLNEQDYRSHLCINWANATEADAHRELVLLTGSHAKKQLTNVQPCALPSRLWQYLAQKALGERAALRWCDLGRKDMNRLTNILTADVLQVTGRSAFKEEFVTCGGIALSSIDQNTLCSKAVSRLYFAGEVLDIDGITGGYNFQAAWTTAHTAARSIATCQ